MKLQNTLTFSCLGKEIILNKFNTIRFRFKSAYMNDLITGTDDTSPTFKTFEEERNNLANSGLAIRPGEIHSLI
jgi:hypothetical protein